MIQKQGFPEENEFVLCTITGVNPHSVFCTLDEYGGRTGMIHISEVAPGRIRNIREYVQEGKKIVCKILRINKEKGHIDLSLRRVNESQRRNKLNEIKQEQLSEKIIEFVAKQTGESPKKLNEKLSEKLLKEYVSLFAAFEEVANDKLNLETLLDKKTAKAFTDIIKQRIKPQEIRIGGDFTLTSYAPDGVEYIREALLLAEKEGVQVRYLGAGTYHVELKGEDYKEAEKILKKAVDATLGYADKHDMTAKFARKELI